MPDTLIQPTEWRTILLVCRKCGKKLKGGFGPKQRDDLKSLLRQTLRAQGHRRDVRVIETGCLGVCPKKGVTALNASHPASLHIIPAGTDAAAAVETLLHPGADGLRPQLRGRDAFSIESA